jgi:hypothetical protein
MPACVANCLCSCWLSPTDTTPSSRMARTHHTNGFRRHVIQVGSCTNGDEPTTTQLVPSTRSCLSRISATPPRRRAPARAFRRAEFSPAGVDRVRPPAGSNDVYLTSAGTDGQTGVPHMACRWRCLPPRPRPRPRCTTPRSVPRRHHVWTLETLGFLPFGAIRLRPALHSCTYCRPADPGRSSSVPCRSPLFSCFCQAMICDGWRRAASATVLAEPTYTGREFCDYTTQRNTVCYFDTGPTFHRHRWTHLSSTQDVKIANHVWRESSCMMN